LQKWHDAHLYIVHFELRRSRREALAGKYRGVRVWVETLIQYLLIDKDLRGAAEF